MTAATTLIAPRALGRRAARRTLLTIFLVCLAPVVASYLAFYVWRPATLRVHGELVQPPVAVDWSDFGVAAQTLRGKWVLALAAPATCDPTCQTRLYQMRQVRVALAQDMGRVTRVWLVSDGGSPEPAVLDRQEGLVVVRHGVTTRLDVEPGRIALVDPQGNLMLRFPQSPDPKLMLKDLQRLLKYSPAGTR